MTLHQPVEAFTSEEINLMRIRFMNETLSKRVLHSVFLKGTSCRPSGMPLMEFYRRAGVDVTKFQKWLSREQLHKITSDPDGKSFDVTLLFVCIRWGSEGVDHGDASKWREGAKNLESLVTAVKKKRNNVVHGQQLYNCHLFVSETEELRAILTETLKAAGSRYKIPPEVLRQEIDEMNDSINSVRDNDFSPKDYEEYKKLNLFSSQSKLVNTEGRKDLQNQYTRKCNTDVNTVNHIIDFNFPVNDIFTELELQNYSDFLHKKTVTLEDILQDKNQKETDDIILIEGPAGAGKTTLVKKILHDWVCSKGAMKYLDSYDLVLHAECRNSHVSSLKELLKHLMPKMSRSFKRDDLERVALDQKLMVILDGLDELNKSSILLFEEVLHLKKEFDITLVITTRPEKLQYFNSYIHSHQMEVKHIRILGIPLKKRDELVMRYYREIKSSKQCVNVQPIATLLMYLKKTQYRLRDLWRLPYNLALLTILWAFIVINIHCITTEPELYWEIHKLYLSKLMERMDYSEATRHLQSSERKRIITFFMYALSEESLIGLKNDHISLHEEAYQRLCSTCNHLGVAAEEMISAFLKKTTAYSSDKIYSFPHKGIQDFYAAYCIWMKLRGEHNYDTHKTITDVYEALTQNHVPVISSHSIISFVKRELATKKVHNIPTRNHTFDVNVVSNEIRRVLSVYSVPQELIQCISAFTSNKLLADPQLATPSVSAGHGMMSSTVIRNIFEELYGVGPFDISKYQNVLFSLIGLLYMEGNTSQAIKDEALRLLQKTGIRDRDTWINILNSVKCDSHVASFISRQQGILDGTVRISDSTIPAYLSLFLAFKPSPGNPLKASITLNVEENNSDINILLDVIIRHKFHVQHIELRKDFKHPKSSNLDEDIINTVFEQCDVRRYMGVMTPKMQLPPEVHQLFISITSDESYAALRASLQSELPLELLDVCVSHHLDATLMEPLPPVVFLNLLLPDIKTLEDVSRASEIARKLNPSSESRKFHLIMFPRCALDQAHLIKQMLLKLRDIDVFVSLCLPSSCKPPSGEEEAELQEVAEKTLASEIRWGEYGIDEW